MDELSSSSKTGIRYWLALLISIPSTCVVFFLLMFLDSEGVFVSWKSLGSPPSGATYIVDADDKNVWVEISGGLIYTHALYCDGDNSCHQWLPVPDRAEIEPFKLEPLRRAQNCGTLGFYHPGKPLAGKIQECVLVPLYGYPDPQFGIEVYYALMTDGKVMYWSHGRGTLSVYAMVLVPIYAAASVTVIISIIYLAKFLIRKYRHRFGAHI